MSDTYTVRNASGTSFSKAAKDIASVWYDYAIPCDASGNVQPAGDTVGRAGFVKLTDGTDTMLIDDVDGALDERLDAYVLTAAAICGQDASAGAGSQCVPLQIAGATKLAAYTTAGTLAVTPSGMQHASDSVVTGTTTPSATLAAAGSGIKYVVRNISVSLAAAANQAPLLIKLTQDKAGTPLVLWQGTLAALANTSQNINLTGLAIPQTVANKALHLEVITGTIVSGNYIALAFTASQAA